MTFYVLKISLVYRTFIVNQHPGMTFIEVCTSDTCIIWHTFRVPLSRDPFIKIIINSLSIYIKFWYMHKNRALWRSIFATSAGKQLNIWPILIVQTILLDRRCTCVRESPTRSTFFHADLTGILPVDIFFLPCRYLYGTPLWLSFKLSNSVFNENGQSHHFVENTFQLVWTIIKR